MPNVGIIVLTCDCYKGWVEQERQLVYCSWWKGCFIVLDKSFDLTECLFNGVKVWTARREEPQEATFPMNQMHNSFDMLNQWIVHYYNGLRVTSIKWAQYWKNGLLNVWRKQLSIHIFFIIIIGDVFNPINWHCRLLKVAFMQVLAWHWQKVTHANYMPPF